MRCLAVALLASSLLAPSVSFANAGDDEATLRRLTVDWMNAIERKDRAALDAIVAPGFSLSAPGDADSGIDRETWLQNAIAKDWSDFEYENVRVLVLGDDAIVTSHLRFRVAPMPWRLDSGIVDVWQRRDGTWRVAARYLGESQVQARMQMAAGVAITLLLVGVLWVVARLRRRRAPRA